MAHIVFLYLWLCLVHWRSSFTQKLRSLSSAQAALAFIGTGSVGLFTIDWNSMASVSLGAGLLSILTSIVTKKV